MGERGGIPIDSATAVAHSPTIASGTRIWQEHTPMADPFTRMKVLGSEVLCYLRPGTECDAAALVRDVNKTCFECLSIDQLQARMRSVADKHALDIEYRVATPHTSAGPAHEVRVEFFPR